MSRVSRKKKAPNAARFSYDGLDPVIHERARLGILTCLAVHPDGLLFREVKELCGLTDGNLSRHLQLLQQSQLIEIWKGFRQRRPQTLCCITQAGREKLLGYVSVLESVVADAQSAARKRRGLRARAVEGWVQA